MIEEQLIFIDREEDSKSDVLQCMIKKAVTLGYIADEVEYTNAVIERENTLPTSIGFGIAIPHGRVDGVLKPFIAMMRTKKPFIWDSRNQEKVDLIFLIGVPEKSDSRLHLKFLSEISKKLIYDEFRDCLRNEQDIQSVYTLLSEINDNIKKEDI